MAKVRHMAEQIIGKVREVGVTLAQVGSVAQGCKAIGVTEQTYYRWCKEFGDLKVEQAKRMKELERENIVALQASNPRPIQLVGPGERLPA